MKQSQEQVCGKIEEWIRAKTKEAGAKGCVVGMSGGVDSSVVAVLAKKALADRMLGLILPCESDSKSKECALLVAKKFGIRTKEIDLSDAFRSLKKILPGSDKKTVGNLKARLRMLVLYYFANTYRYLVLGTSNKSELMIGYVTKYGDSAVDLEPIGDLYKTEVLQLAKYLGIPEEIINAKPTAGLWKGQTDEKEIGMSYETLDGILKTLETGKNCEKFERNLVEKVKRMVKAGEHKRRMPEICVL